MAAKDGQLVPGDRLLFVNDVSLENATLDQAVQALKGAPLGIVRIGVTKPLPITDSPVRYEYYVMLYTFFSCFFIKRIH